jgi:hypothetical protein
MMSRSLVCKGCGNNDAYIIRTYLEDGIRTESCDKCGRRTLPLLRDDTERALYYGLGGKAAERTIQEHRKQKAELEKRYPVRKGKADTLHAS